MRKNQILTGLAGAAALARSIAVIWNRHCPCPTPANIAGNDPTTNTSTATITRNIDVDGNGTKNDTQIGYRSFNAGGGAYVIQQSFIFSNNYGQTAAYGPVGANSQWFYAYQAANGAGHSRNLCFRPKCHLPDTFWLRTLTAPIMASPASGSLGARGFAGFSFLNASNVLCFGFIDLQTNAWTGAGTIGVQFFGLAYDNSGAPITTLGPGTQYPGCTGLWRNRIGRSSLSPAQERLIFSTS